MLRRCEVLSKRGRHRTRSRSMDSRCAELHSQLRSAFRHTPKTMRPSWSSHEPLFDVEWKLIACGEFIVETRHATCKRGLPHMARLHSLFTSST
eukprot:4201477-Pleurochrysis_carterae.AAC.2